MEKKKKQEREEERERELSSAHNSQGRAKVKPKAARTFRSPRMVAGTHLLGLSPVTYENAAARDRWGSELPRLKLALQYGMRASQAAT